MTERKKTLAKKYWAIGVDRDQADMGPDVVLTSALKRVDVAVKRPCNENERW